MDLLVLGASGRCGRLLTRLAIERGHRVTALSRPGSEHTIPPGAGVVLGEATNREDLKPLLDSHQTVLSALGLNRDGPSPWSRLRSPRDLVERVSESVRDRATDDDGFRFIWISAGGVGPSLSKTTAPVRAMIGLGNVGVAYEDLRRAERGLEAVAHASYPVRPVTLLPGDTGTTAGAVERYGLLSTVRRGAVARYMLGAAESQEPLGPPPLLIG